MAKTVESIISDQKIEEVHGYANFGNMTKRDVVNVGVAQSALGYSMGHTMRAILIEHRLVKNTGGYHPRLTRRGESYLHALVGGRASEVISYISQT